MPSEFPDPVTEPVAEVGTQIDLGGGYAGADRKRTAGSRATVVHGGRRRPRPPRRRRWTRRALVATGVVVVLIVVLGLGGFFYFDYEFHQIKKVVVNGLAHAKPGKPFTVLVAGSDSRAFVTTPGQCKSFGCGADTGGQRSDVIILVRVVPAARKIEMLSIPRDTWVTIPGNVEYISGQNRINAAFNSGPSLLVQTIVQDFHIPINYFVEVNFPGLQGMVNAIGGIHLDFKYPLRDREYVNGQATNPTGLNVLTTGCQVVQGTEALALVRSRNIEYETHRVWDVDYGSDFTRIRNQQAFFRAVIHQLNAEITNPIALTGFINAAVHNLTIDQTMTEGTMYNLAREFHNFAPGSLEAVTLPTVGPYTTSGGADVLLPAAAADEPVIQSFLAFGTSAATGSTTTTAAATSMKATQGGTPVAALVGETSASGTSTTTTTPANQVTVTTIAQAPPGETPIYNNTPAPYDPTPC